MKQKFINCYLEVAKQFANLSHARRLKAGCVIVKNNKIISCGYNGTPSGYSNVCEWTTSISPKGEKTLVTKEEVIHAEMNAILGVTQSNESTVGSTMFCTHFPCMNCAKHIVQSGITKVFFTDLYKETEFAKTKRFLEECGVSIQQVKLNEKEKTITQKTIPLKSLFKG